MTIQINTVRLIDNAKASRWEFGCAQLLLVCAGLRQRGDSFELGLPTDDEIKSIPDTFDYVKLRSMIVSGRRILDIAESLDGADPIKHGGRLLLTIARELFVPEIPEDHPGYLPSLRLLRTFDGYLDGKVGAEAYMAEAYRHRAAFGNTFGNRNRDDYSDLFDALPAEGLETVIALGGWRLDGHLDCFGRFLAARRPEVRALEFLRERVPETLFVDLDDDEDDLDGKAEEAAQEMIDEEIATYIDEEIESLSGRLIAIVDRVLGYTQAA